VNWVTCNTQTKLNLAITFSLIMTIQRASIFFYCPLKKGAKQTEMIESWILFAKPCQGCIIKKLHLGNHSVSIQKIFLQLLPHFEVITCLINYLFCKWRGLCPPVNVDGLICEKFSHFAAFCENCDWILAVIDGFWSFETFFGFKSTQFLALNVLWRN